MEEFINVAFSGCLRGLIEKYKDKLLQEHFPLFIYLFQDPEKIKFYSEAGMPLPPKVLGYFISRKDLSEEKKEEFLLWLKDSSPEEIKEDEALARMIKTNQWSLFSSLYQKFTPAEKTYFNLARYGGKEKTTEYIPDLFPSAELMSPSLWLGAIKRKEREFYHWLIKMRSPAPSKVLCAALEEGEIDLIKNLMEGEKKLSCWSTEFSSLCAEKNNVEMLDWALERGCPINSDALYYATRNNAEDVIFYLSEN